jgi:hypothetical protein
MLSGMLVAAGISGLLLTAVAATYMLSLRSFASFRDVIDMESQGRRASDQLGEDIRSAARVIKYENQALVLGVGTNEVAIRYDHPGRTLVRECDGRRRVLLQDCDSIQYQFFARAQTNDGYGLLPTSGATNANAVMIQWRCSRWITGSATNVMDRQTPRFVMRKSLL